jgi:hypothetical protein
MTDARQVAAAATHDALATVWSQWGRLDDDVLTHLINPAFMGGPRWPGLRQAYRVARRDAGEVLLASDGLSDPFDADAGPQDVNGCGLELFATTSDPIDQLPGSWLWDIVWQMSNFAAKHGGIRDLLDEMGTLSTELYDVKIPEPHAASFVNASGRVGVMLGLPDPQIPASVAGPLSSIRLVDIKLLTRSELELAADQGDAGRARLEALFAAQGGTTHSSLHRPSVV